MAPLLEKKKRRSGTAGVEADEVKRLRSSIGWTQAQAADEAGVKTSVISSWETGRQEPSLTAWRCYRAAAAARTGILNNRWPPPGVHEIEEAVAKIVEAREREGEE